MLKKNISCFCYFSRKKENKMCNVIKLHSTYLLFYVIFSSSTKFIKSIKTYIKFFTAMEEIALKCMILTYCISSSMKWSITVFYQDFWRVFQNKAH